MPDMVPVWKTGSIPAEIKLDGPLSRQFVRALNQAYPVPFLTNAENGYVLPVRDEQVRTVGDSLNYYQEAYVCGLDLHAQSVRSDAGGCIFAITLRGQAYGDECYASALLFEYDPAARKLMPHMDHPWLGTEGRYFPAGMGKSSHRITDDGTLRTYFSGSSGILSYLECVIPGREMITRCRMSV